MRRSLVVISLLAIAVLSACGAAAAPAIQAPAPTTAPMFESHAPRQALGMGGGSAPQKGFTDSSTGAPQPPAAPAPGQPQQSDRLVIQNADLTIVVSDVAGRVRSIEGMASSMGGFLVSENVYQTVASGDNSVLQAQMVVRVPNEKLDEALAQIKQNTVDVQNETRTGNDVTDQYVDLQSRLKAKQAAEAQLMTIMQGATKTQDVLDVYAQLQQVQSDIEVLKGQIKYYEQSAALSAISVNIVAEETVKPLQGAGWKPEGVARDALQQLIYFWQAFVDFLIRFFLYILPVLLTLGLPLFLAFLILRWILRRTRKPRAVVPVETPK